MSQEKFERGITQCLNFDDSADANSNRLPVYPACPERMRREPRPPIFGSLGKVPTRSERAIPQHPNHLQVIIDIRYQCAIILSLRRHDYSACPSRLWRSQIRPCRKGGCPANHARPPGSPSNFFRILPSHTITFSPTIRSHKSFSCNTYEFPRKCCKQKTYSMAKPFRCNTYKKQGVGASALRIR